MVKLLRVSIRESSEQATERERFRTRAARARECVARLDPTLLDTSGVDLTLHDLTLAKSVLGRLDDAYRHELGNAWLRELNRAKPSVDR